MQRRKGLTDARLAVQSQRRLEAPALCLRAAVEAEVLASPVIEGTRVAVAGGGGPQDSYVLHLTMTGLNQ